MPDTDAAVPVENIGIAKQDSADDQNKLLESRFDWLGK